MKSGGVPGRARLLQVCWELIQVIVIYPRVRICFGLVQDVHDMGGEYMVVHGLNRHSFNGSSRVEAKKKTLACCPHGERDSKSWVPHTQPDPVQQCLCDDTPCTHFFIRLRLTTGLCWTWLLRQTLGFRACRCRSVLPITLGLW